MKVVKTDADNLIYNRYDIIYDNNVEVYSICVNDKNYRIYAYVNNGYALLNVSGKKYPQEVFDKVIRQIFDAHNDLFYIEVSRGYNNYDNELLETNDIVLQLPESAELLNSRLSQKHRYNVRRDKRNFENCYGKINIIKYENRIPDYIVDTFFKWKNETHNRDYAMSAQDYLKKYYVTNAVVLSTDREPFSIVFYCKVEDTVYLENLSYNPEYQRFSPGFMGYEAMLEDLILKKCKYVFLGGGDYIYKRYYGSEEHLAYSGRIYSPYYYKKLNEYFSVNGISQVAIYGFGKYGQLFWDNRRRINVSIVYGIDKNPIENDEIRIYGIDDNWPNVDAIIITVKTDSNEIEKLLKSKGIMRFYSYIDMYKII